MIKRRLAVPGGFDLVIVRPVLGASPEPRAFGLVAFPHDGVFHGGRSQVGEELALYPRGPGCWREKRVLQKADQLIKSRLS